MTLHGPEHEALLQALATGEISVDADEIRKRRETCPECRERIDVTLTVITHLHDAAEFRRRVLDRAEGLEVPGAEERARLIRGQLDRRGGSASGSPRRRRRPPFSRFLAVAAALVVLVVGGWLVGLFDPAGEVIMGGGFELIAPIGEVSSFDRFEWSYSKAAPGSYFRVEVWPEDGEPFTSLQPIHGNHWQPGSSVTETWQRIEWRVTAYLPDGSEDGVSPRGSAHLP